MLRLAAASAAAAKIWLVPSIIGVDRQSFKNSPITKAQNTKPKRAAALHPAAAHQGPAQWASITCALRLDLVPANSAVWLLSMHSPFLLPALMVIRESVLCKCLGRGRFRNSRVRDGDFHTFGLRTKFVGRNPAQGRTAWQLPLERSRLKAGAAARSASPAEWRQTSRARGAWQPQIAPLGLKTDYCENVEADIQKYKAACPLLISHERSYMCSNKLH